MKKDKLSAIFSKQRLIIFFRNWMIPMTSLLLLVFLSLEGASIYSSYQELQIKISEKDEKATKLTNLRGNVMLPKTEIDTYGAIYAKQVPIKEDVFQTFSFIEELSSDTGFEISELSEANEPLTGTQAIRSKSFTISGSTSPNILQSFLDKYKNFYSRVMVMNTMTKSQIGTPGSAEEVSFSAGFKLISIPSVADLANQETSSIQLLSFENELAETYERIKEQTNLDLLSDPSSESEEIPTDYETIKSLF